RAAELARERAAGSEEQSFNGALAQLELSGDLAVREALPLAQQDRALLVRRQLRERVCEAGQLVVRPDRGNGEARKAVGIVRGLEAVPPPGRPAALATDVLGDLEEPGQLGARHDSLPQATERVQEGVLDRVLCLLAAGQPA